jgi:hypothetical protein
MKYTIELVHTIEKEIEAESPEEAVRLAEKQNPYHRAEHIKYQSGSTSYVDVCYSCGKPLFEDSNYSVDLDNMTAFCNDTCVPLKFDACIDPDDPKN